MVLTAAVCVVPAIVAIPKPPPVALIVMVFDPLAIEIPVPGVRVAAAGTPAVEPTISWPSAASAVKTGVPVNPVVNTA